MKSSLSALLAMSFLVLVNPAFSQTGQPQAVPPQAAPSQAAPPKGNYAECRASMRQQKTAKDQRRDFMKDCMKDVTASCQEKAKAQKLHHEERKSFMRACTGRPAAPAKT